MTTKMFPHKRFRVIRRHINQPTPAPRFYYVWDHEEKTEAAGPFWEKWEADEARHHILEIEWKALENERSKERESLRTILA